MTTKKPGKQHHAAALDFEAEPVAESFEISARQENGKPDRPVQTEAIIERNKSMSEASNINIQHELLSGVSTCLQLADENHNITYLNPALIKMFNEAAPQIRKALPHFDPDQLVGQNMDLFHKNPAHQRAMMSDLKKSVQSKIALGGRHFTLKTTPLSNGTLIEWADVTLWIQLIEAFEAVAKGDLSYPIEDIAVNDETSISLLASVRQVRDNLRRLVADTHTLAQAAVEGNLAIRADISKHEGDFRSILQGVNETLDAVIGPLNVASHYVDNIAKGNIPDHITDAYNGDFNTMKNNLNQCIDSINGFVTDMQHMSSEHDKGDIDVTMDTSKFQGAYAKMAQGVNDMVLGHIAVKKKAMACVQAFGAGNFDAELEQFPGKKAFINDTIELVRSNIKSFIADMKHMSDEHDKGDIDVTMDTSKFRGAYADMAQGVNTMVLGHIAVKKKAMACVQAFGAGNFDAELEQFPGKKAFINDTIELVRSNLKAIINDATSLSQAIVDGKLDIRADVSRHQGDYVKIIAAFENAFVGLNNTFYQISDTVEQVSQSAGKMNAASQIMASMSEEQSSSVEEITASLEQTDSQVKANTDNAKTANQLVMSTSQAANEGQQKMSLMVEAMRAINQSAQNIAKIIKVIDEIAFQTNLLALNAAVEAARAGQHGRGFAVVAQEVRNLAGRSAKAARETADLIEDSSKRVAEGVGIANETREALDQIVDNVIKVKDLVAEIATASTEQSTGVSQINLAMNQVAQATQEGSHQAEELATASDQLTHIANQMRSEISHFKLRERQRQASDLGIPGLEGFTPEMLNQLKAMLAAQQAVSGAVSKAATPARTRPSAKTLLPLDADERGFNGF
ncbi:MAG: methyl-accepting chemotaxis protein [Methylovulum sp.]|nr:methyl-accepting chemotaxis protein [Methylovulum sp.]